MPPAHEQLFFAQVEALIARSRHHLEALAEAQRRLRVDAGDAATALRQRLAGIETELALAIEESARLLAGQGPVREAVPPPAGPALPEGLRDAPRLRSAVGRRPAQGRGSDPEVATLQRILACFGFAVPVDGQFDVQTQQALRAWQRQEGLKPDGVAGAATRQRMNAWLDAGRTGEVREDAEETGHVA